MAFNQRKISWVKTRSKIRSAPHNVKSYWRCVRGVPDEVELTSEKEFMSLVWHEIDGCRLITPPDSPRTMANVVDRLFEKDYSFEILSQDMGLCSKKHNPEWFHSCCEIYNNFCYIEFKSKPIWLRPLNHGEKDQSPQGTYYILDGCHRALVLAKLLQENKIRYEPFNPILILPNS